MAKQVAPNASYHYNGLGIKDEELDEGKLAQCLVCVRGTDFEDGNEIETETDEGHTGVSNLDMGSYRTTAESSPSWQDALRYKEGLEDYFYLLLANYTKTTYNDGTNDVSGVNKFHYEMPPNNTKELPLATIYNGFAKTSTDARVFDNAMLNECEFSFSNEDRPTISPTFVSDYNNFNLINPTRTFIDPTQFVKAPQTQIYLGAVGATEAQMLANPVDCFTEASLTINNNAESQSCHGDEFGKNTKFMGAREVEGDLTMPWTDASKYLETEYEGYDKYAHIVSEEITNKQIWFSCKGGKIGSTDVPYSCLIKLPEVEVTNVTSTKSGDEAKDLTMEFKVLEKPTQSYMIVDIVSDLTDLHIDKTGTTLDALKPTVAPFVTEP